VFDGNRNGRAIEGTHMGAVPTVDALARDVAQVVGLPRDMLIALLLKCAATQSNCAAVQTAISAELVRNAAESHLEPPVREKLSRKSKGEAHQPARQDGPTLSAEEACKLLHKPRKWLFRNSSRLSFVHRISRKHLVCDENGLRQWLIAHADRLTA
jgi:hypothetical protein